MHIRICAAILLTVLAACSDADPRLMNVGTSSRAPDEFSILPTKPLEAPDDFSALPPPTPGGSNRTDPQPEAEAILALGGNPDAGAGGGALVAAASRFGVSPNIRATLAAEDLDFRRKNDGRLLERIFDVNVYFRAYAPLALDQEAELARLRRLGVRTVAAPPGPGFQ
ncbi:DUF3035 domain-containing protein [Jannaschia sp. Os4]|uniref:DUF3035 domain-containing protein n=1 Tax=Jannaschia sp. Os4 TaxID=2807617 RepID=UPI00193997E1|nr:DUF3035 domain-containing protein [Jannaschia sp. Os4]MBM2574803.1 DUF3035 domain-containing protein [Jannaschia sp. Os4]